MNILFTASLIILNIIVHNLFASCLYFHGKIPDRSKYPKITNANKPMRNEARVKKPNFQFPGYSLKSDKIQRKYFASTGKCLLQLAQTGSRPSKLDESFTIVKTARKDPDDTDYETVVKEIQREGYFLSIIHAKGIPNIAKGKFYYRVDPQPQPGQRKKYSEIWMPEYAKRSLMDAREIPWRQSSNALLQLSNSLNRLHSANILHLDIKPDNIFMDKTNKPYWADFGEAQQLKMNDVIRFKVGRRPGSEDHQSPEIKAWKYSEETDRTIEVPGKPQDIYSFGAAMEKVFDNNWFIKQKATLTTSQDTGNRKQDTVNLKKFYTGLQSLIGDMKAIDPRMRPTAEQVSKRMSELMPN